jgi:hypothetical protein
MQVPGDGRQICSGTVWQSMGQAQRSAASDHAHGRTYDAG